MPHPFRNDKQVPPTGFEETAKNIGKTSISGASAAKSAANRGSGESGGTRGSGGEGDSAEVAALKHFLAVATRGREIGARPKERAAARFAKLVATVARKLDAQTAAGAGEFLKVAQRDPKLVSGMFQSGK